MSRYNSFTVKDLKSEVTRRQLPGRSKLTTKFQMVERLEEGDQFHEKSKEDFSSKTTSNRSTQMVSKTPEKKYEQNDLTRLLALCPKKEWDYQLLSENPNITWDIVQAHPGKPWDYSMLSGNPSITWEVVQSTLGRPEIDWDYSELSANPNITWDIVQANPDPPGGKWDYQYLSKNPNITWEIVRDNPNPPGGKWDYYQLSRNPNITWDIVQSTKGLPKIKWNYPQLSTNKFLYDKNSVRYKKMMEKRRKETKRVLDPYVIKDISRIIGKYL